VTITWRSTFSASPLRRWPETPLQRHRLRHLDEARRVRLLCLHQDAYLGSASYAALQDQIGDGGTYFTGLLLLRDAHRLSRWRAFSGRPRLSGGTRCLCPSTPLGSDGRTSHLLHRSRGGRCPAPRHGPRRKKCDR
jgi:hypothetical protein